MSIPECRNRGLTSIGIFTNSAIFPNYNLTTSTKPPTESQDLANPCPVATWHPAMHSVAPFSTVCPASPHPQTEHRIRSKAPILTKRTVPGSSQRFIDKSRSLTADCVAYDLEDSVTPHKKAEARSLVRRALDQPAPEGIRERAVRINSVDSGLALGDLTEVVSLSFLSWTL